MPKRHWCKQCGCWLQGDEKSIRLHESQWRHKNRVQAIIRKGKREKFKKQKEQEKLQRELDRISNAAEVAVGIKTKQNQKFDDKNIQQQQTNDEINQAQNFYEEIDEIDQVVEPGEILGQYTMDGVLFLQGNWHEDLLVDGTPCEAIIVDDDDNDHDDDDGWKSGYVNNVSVIREGIKIKRNYWLMLQGETKPRLVNPRDIRLRAPKPPPIESKEEKDAADGWETIAVRVTNETTTESNIKQEEPNQLKISNNNDDPEEQDAYTTFNPFGGKYKGFDIDTSDNKRTNFETTSKSSSHQPQTTTSKPKFKKRKKKKQS